MLLQRHRWLRTLSIVIALVLLGDALMLMGRGQFNLGVTLPAAVAIMLLTLVALRGRIARRLAERPRLRSLWRLGWVLLILWLVSLLFFWAHLWARIRTDDQLPQVDAIIVLGSSTRDGQPSLTLAYRLDTAADLARAQPHALVVTSGGVDFGQVESEGRIMANYLRTRHHIADDRLIQEEQSTSTALNLSLSMALLRERGIPLDAPVAIVTSDFHTLRAQWIAEKTGFANTVTVAAPTPGTIRFNAWLREYFAVASSWLLREF